MAPEIQQTLDMQTGLIAKAERLDRQCSADMKEVLLLAI